MPQPLVPQPVETIGEGVVGRALRVLGEIAASPDAAPLSLAELVRRTELPKTTVHRLAGALQQQGFIERDPAGYRISASGLALPTRAARDDALRRTTMPHLMELYLQVRETVSLCVLHGGRVVHLETLFEGRHRRLVQLTGVTGPAHATAAGKLLLAYRPPPPDRPGPDGSLTAFTDRTITDPAELAVELARVRREGIAFSDGEHLPGAVGIAVPLVGPGRRPVAAIAVGGPRARIDQAAVASQLRLTGIAASAALSPHHRPPAQRRGGPA
ncbi:IclR family transcriptional regulator [Dactylosporangium sp. CA-092794]|uniref:IclR family transcriptional regulator n=1 Tax=Dactylosporangium sp. CA-092794 TaxID=3239929 RepID=UPI003D94F04E